MTTIGRGLRSESGSSGAAVPQTAAERCQLRSGLQQESQVHGHRGYSGDNGFTSELPTSTINEHDDLPANLPMTVKAAARFLGVSPQTVYLWVERKQIPHLRVMGRNIRFLQSELEPFRAQFKQEVDDGKTA